MPSLFPDWFFWFVPAWLALCVLLSVFFRRSRGKPIIPRVPPNAIYSESSASGPWASNCLIVAVTADAFVVTPKFPFNLMFGAEIFGLEHNIPRSHISHVESERSWSSNLTISLRDGRKIRLKVADPGTFAAALGSPK